MRFSLGTLILVILWLAALALVWLQREPWVRFYPAGGIVIGSIEHSTSCDTQRRIEIRHIDESPDCVVIVANSGSDEGRVLWEKDGNFRVATLFDENTMGLDDYQIPEYYHRRFPEWWWGHFYRPEVWTAIVLSGVLLLQLIRRARTTSQSKAR